MPAMLKSLEFNETSFQGSAMEKISRNLFWIAGWDHNYSHVLCLVGCEAYMLDWFSCY